MGMDQNPLSYCLNTIKYLDDSGFWICEKDAHPFADYFGVNRRAPGFLFITHTNMMKW